MEEVSRYTVPTEWLTLKRVSLELSMDYKRVLEWPRRKVDPLPVYLIDGNKKQGRVRRCDLDEWLVRNSEMA